jgi:hypothetical protein
VGTRKDGRNKNSSGFASDDLRRVKEEQKGTLGIMYEGGKAQKKTRT